MLYHILLCVYIYTIILYIIPKVNLSCSTLKLQVSQLLFSDSFPDGFNSVWSSTFTKSISAGKNRGEAVEFFMALVGVPYLRCDVWRWWRWWSLNCTSPMSRVCEMRLREGVSMYFFSQKGFVEEMTFHHQNQTKFTRAFFCWWNRYGVLHRSLMGNLHEFNTWLFHIISRRMKNNAICQGNMAKSLDRWIVWVLDSQSMLFFSFGNRW